MLISITATLFFLLLGIFSLTLFSSICRSLPSHEIRNAITRKSALFFYRYIHRNYFSYLLLLSVYTKNMMRLSYGAVALFFCQMLSARISFLFAVSSFINCIALFFILGDLIPRIIFSSNSKKLLKRISPLASLYLTIFFPLNYCFLKTSAFFSKYNFPKRDTSITTVKGKVLDLIQEAFPSIQPHETKIIESILEFHQRKAKECFYG